VIGRYYAMDRDKRWERTRLAYDMLVHGIGTQSDNLVESIKQSYTKGITDEFIQPIVLSQEGNPVGLIKPGDTVIFFNFRTDRPRQLVTVLTQKAIKEFGMEPLDLDLVMMTQYDQTFVGVEILFENDNLVNTLGEFLSDHGKSQVRMAETEKYPHVTFFFSGGRETPFNGERRIMIPSPKVATYDLQPEMSAEGLTSALLEDIKTELPDFVCINYANTDMVGHTGVFSAAVKAAETVDKCLSRVIPAALEAGYGIIIIADHGNSDMMRNPDGSPNTAHTMNPVPVIYVSAQSEPCTIENGKLADIAPTILGILGITPPPEMTGKNLITTG